MFLKIGLSKGIKLIVIKTTTKKSRNNLQHGTFSLLHGRKKNMVILKKKILPKHKIASGLIIYA